MTKHRKAGKARTRGPSHPNPKHRRDVEADTPAAREDERHLRLITYVVPRPREGDK